MPGVNKKNAEKLLSDIQKKIQNWNERSSFTLKGVKNLSMADLETLELYADTYIRTGGFYGLMEPRGAIAQVLVKYNIVVV